jgi:hypothetical protein
MADFIPGLQLAEAYYDVVVRPLLGDIVHSAALIDWGSEVLGFDTVRSTDHGWGPRLNVFVLPEDTGIARVAVEGGLPDEFMGWPTRFGWDEYPVTDHVSVSAVGGWFSDHLGFDPRDGVPTRNWLLTPSQHLLETTAGAVFHDGLGDLGTIRASLEWYPHDVWLWLLACQWRRIDQEEPFVGRTAEVGDELGSRVIAARLCRDIMRLCFLLERRYAPYSKWFGTAFSRLEASRDVGPALDRALGASDYPTREAALVEACEALARRQNALGITEPQEPTVRWFYDRPFRVLSSDRFVRSCLARVEDPWLRSLPLVGGIDQISDSSDFLDPDRARDLSAIYNENA